MPHCCPLDSTRRTRQTLSPKEDFTIQHKVTRGRDGDFVLPELTF